MFANISIGAAEYICLQAIASLWVVEAAVNCTAEGAGRFADDDYAGCQNYVLCVYDSSTDSYLSYNYTCPTTSVFNPDTSLCTDPANYECPDTNSTTNSTTCTSEGYFADSNSTDCTSYIMCTEINGTYVETDYTCPNGTYYDPDTTLCEGDYVCNNTSTTTTFTCTAAGRFADTSVAGCQSYYLCVYTTSGYVQYLYECPTSSLFNPSSQVCTASYTCTT